MHIRKAALFPLSFEGEGDKGGEVSKRSPYIFVFVQEDM